jgi:hypothetical protein
MLNGQAPASRTTGGLPAEMQSANFPPTGCPMHGAASQRRVLSAGDELVFPMHKRAFTQYSTQADGTRELHLYYGDKEVSFDEPELFPFGEQLARHSRFVAVTSTTWGMGYEWPRMRELLEQLLEEGILHRADPAGLSQDGGQAAGDQASPLPAARTATPRSWFECEAITRELTGQGLELGYLELIVPIFRVAHMAMDAEGRQVGEANVYPQPLRLDVPTRWRKCIYEGSRYLDAKPMNVTALKAMRAHWDQVMAALLRIRAAYLQRFPAAVRNGFTLGDLERLSTLVLAIPTYQLMRTQGRVENGALHPALSSMFRVTDGLRMTTHQMLFLPVNEATLSPDSPVTSAEIYEYAERNYSFHSTHGVCAGPKAMIEEFLDVLVDGKGMEAAASVTLDPALEAALADMDEALDYGLYGLQAFAVVFSLWPVMTRTYAQLSNISRAWSEEPSDTVTRMGEYLQAKMQILQKETLHATEEWRTNRERVYGDIYEQCAFGLGWPVHQELAQRIAPKPTDAHLETANRLRAILRRNCYDRPPMDDHDAEQLLQCLMNYFLQAQAILGLACDIQQNINSLLERPAPSRPFRATDVDVHVLLQGDEARRLPHLLDELESLLGFRVEITRDKIEITDAAAAAQPNLPARGRR